LFPIFDDDGKLEKKKSNLNCEEIKKRKKRKEKKKKINHSYKQFYFLKFYIVQRAYSFPLEMLPQDQFFSGEILCVASKLLSSFSFFFLKKSVQFNDQSK